MDIERVNLVINFDFPSSKDAYLHRVGRAGRFGTKGLTISFVRTEDEEVIGGKEGEAKTDKEVLMEIQDGFKIKIGELPAQIDTNLYMWDETDPIQTIHIHWYSYFINFCHHLLFIIYFL